MIVEQDFESNIIAGHSPNHLVLSEVDGFINVTFSASFLNEDVIFKRIAHNGNVNLKLLAITKNVNNNGFDFSNAIFSNQTLTVTITDAGSGTYTKELIVLNSALQISEGVIMPWFLNKRLGHPKLAEPLVNGCNLLADIQEPDNIVFNYDLNFNLH